MHALLIDREEIYRLSLKEIIRHSNPALTICEACGIEDFLKITAKISHFDLVLLNISSMGDNGETCLQLIQRLYPNASLMIINNKLSGPLQHTEIVNRHITLPRCTPIQQLSEGLKALQRLPVKGTDGVADKTSAISKNIGANLPNPQQAADTQLAQPKASEANIDEMLPDLSKRQKEILLMAAEGLPNKEIAIQLNIAEGTVKAHMHSIFKLIGVSNRTQAVLRFQKLLHPVANQPQTQPAQDQYEKNRTGKVAGRYYNFADIQPHAVM